MFPEIPSIVLMLLLVSSTLSQERPGQSKRLARSDSSICYGYTHRLRSYDVTLDPETDVAELRCCHMRSIMNLARWRILGSGGTNDQLPYCSDVDDVDFACWKYVSRLSVRLFVNVTKLRETGEATFLCGTEPMSDDEFTLTTKIRVTSPDLPTPTPTTFFVEELKPKLPNVLASNSCRLDLSDRVSNGVDSQCEQKKIVTCFGNVSSLLWTVGKKSRSRPVAECANAKCPVESCWKVSASEDGLELHLSRERKSTKAAFRCGEVAGQSQLCSFKAVWD
ncbi:uncharacterized protein [Oscarella lobularis]|uniref:uncharacterized protein isoform X2 n=1 Tax=Oscarella lobularis TaxID=121494 RepID=UPI003313A020